MSAELLGFGVAWPAHELSAERCVELLSSCTNVSERIIQALVRRSGVRQRRSVLNADGEDGLAELLRANPPHGASTARRMQLFAEHGPPLAERAAHAALNDSSVAPEEITHLVCVCCTGFMAPGLDHALATALGLPSNVQRSLVSFMGCHGALNGLRVAQAFAEQHATHRVLLVALELCSLHVQAAPTESELVANTLFGDGAAALVMAAGQASPCHVAGASQLIPDSANMMSWRIGDAGFRMGLSARVPAVLGVTLRPWLERWLAEHSLSVDQIGGWAVHPGGPRILGAVGQALELSPDALANSRALLAQHGNMSSPSVLMLLRELAQSDTPRPWLALAFGPGLSAELALFR